MGVLAVLVTRTGDIVHKASAKVPRVIVVVTLGTLTLFLLFPFFAIVSIESGDVRSLMRRKRQEACSRGAVATSQPGQGPHGGPAGSSGQVRVGLGSSARVRCGGAAPTPLAGVGSVSGSLDAEVPGTKTMCVR